MTTTPTNYLSWTAITTGINNTGPNADPALFIPHGERPDTPQHALLRDNQIYQTTNAGTLWASISPQPFAGSTGNISTISIAPGGTATSGMAYAGTTDGQVVVVQIAGAVDMENVSSAACLLAMYHVAITPRTPPPPTPPFRVSPATTAIRRGTYLNHEHWRDMD